MMRRQQLSALRADYDVGEELGRGSFSIVRKATRKSDGRDFAVKIIKRHNVKTPEAVKALKAEIDILQRAHHRNVVRLHDVFEDKKNHYLVMDHLGGGELFDRIEKQGQYSEQDAAQAVRHIALALRYLHSRGVVHRDLKPENLVYLTKRSDSFLILTDFGLACEPAEMPMGLMRSECGTPAYVAPEIIGLPEDAGGIPEGYGKECDCWSLGVITYILLCGYPPFYSEQHEELYEQIVNGDYEFHEDYWGNISSEAKSLVVGLLTVDPRKRLTAEQVLEHPWVKGETKSKAIQEKRDRMKLAMRLKHFRARQRLRQGVMMVCAINRLTAGLKQPVPPPPPPQADPHYVG